MSGMAVYFTRRLMLVPITFLAITFMVYAILRVVPGGPIEQAETMMKLAAASGEGGAGGGAGEEANLQLDEDAMADLEEYYSLDQPIPIGYLQWLGVWPRTKKTRVPPVPIERHQEAVKRLQDAAQAVAEAREALAAHLEPRGLLAQDGRLWRPAKEGEVADDVRAQADRLEQRTFGDRTGLHAFLAARDLATIDGTLCVPADVAEEDPFAVEAGRLEDALAQARTAQAKAETETGYYLNDVGKPVQTGFRVLHGLNDARNEATERLQALLGSESMIAYAGRVYVKVTEEERKAEGKKDFFEEAESLAKKGFAKRDDLLFFLAEEGYTWQGGDYYRLLTPEEQASRETMLATADALTGVRRLANAKLAQVEEDEHLRITGRGAIYRLRNRVSGVLELDFGQSYSYNEPVLHLIGSKMEVSIQFGLIGYFLTWIVCVPLGVFKAIKHRSLFDSASSVAVFFGYSIPGFVLCLILLTVAPKLGLPLGGYKPDNIEMMGWWDSFTGRVRHMLIPVAGYMVGAFATMTILMKNTLLENLGQDYVRTAFAKGLSERRVIFLHALRNSLIPITAGIGAALALLFAGSFLIEKTCNIDGMGLLGFNAILSRDYPIILGLLVLLVLIQLFGNILSDIIWAMIDPRIRFGR